MLPRLKEFWPAKLGWMIGSSIAFWILYSVLARNTWFSPWTPPRTWLDAVIPYRPDPWAWVYLSQFVFATMLPWLIDSREVFRRYVRGVVVMCGACFTAFLWLPVASPRSGDAAASSAMQLILMLDGPFNAFPSLHAGFATYLGRLAWRMFGASSPRRVCVAVTGCGAAILYSTLATRQHYAADLLAGSLVGIMADWFVWRSRRAEGVNAATTMSRRSGAAFQEGCK